MEPQAKGEHACELLEYYRFQRQMFSVMAQAVGWSFRAWSGVTVGGSVQFGAVAVGPARF